jgi:hypothetical protein
LVGLSGCAAYTVRHCTPARDGKGFNVGAELTAFIGTPGEHPNAAVEALLGHGSSPLTPIR